MKRMQHRGRESPRSRVDLRNGTYAKRMLGRGSYRSHANLASAPALTDAQPTPAKRPLLKRALLRALAGLNAVVPKSPKKILLHSVPDLEDGILAVLEELLTRGHRPVLLLDNAAKVSTVERRFSDRVAAVPKNSWPGLYQYMRAGRVITTHGLFGAYEPPRRQVVTNIWHGEALSKPVGLWDGQPPVRSTLATALSSVGKAFRCAEFGLNPAKVLVLGAPRNDRLLRADRSSVRRRVLSDESTAVFLWLPTYRNAVIGQRRIDGEPYTSLLPFEEATVLDIDSWLLAENALLLVKPHPLGQQGETGEYHQIRYVDTAMLEKHGVSLYELLASVDCLITDVSSVWVDYLLVDRPLIFAFPDLEAYRATRGIHLEPYDRWVPGPLATTGSRLLDEMKSVVRGEDSWAHMRSDTKLRLHRHLDAGSTVRLLDVLRL